MEEVTEPRQSLYYPISVSEIATNNARVRRNSLREYSHAQNAAHRAFCRAPGRPQTAAFGRVYYSETRDDRRRRSLSPSKANLRECVVASKATVREERNDVAVNNYTTKASRSRSAYAERRLLSRPKTARKTLQHPAEQLYEKEAVKCNIFVKGEEETDDLLIDLEFGHEEKRCDADVGGELKKSTSVQNCVSAGIDGQLIVHHFVDSGCSCTSAIGYHEDASVGYEACSCDQRFVASSYCVEVQGEGYQSTPGLGRSDSQQNKALWRLLEKQLSAV